MLSNKDKLQITTKHQNLDTRLDSFIAKSEQFLRSNMLNALDKLHDLPLTPIPASQSPDYQTDSEDDDLNNPFIT
jgi:hypothetical protein